MSSPGRTRAASFSPSRQQQSTTNSDEARLEHIATECIAKAVNIVLQARLSSLHKRTTQNRWFNLETVEVINKPTLEALENWKRDTSSTLVCEIYGEKKATGTSEDSSSSSSSSTTTSDARLLEAWTFQVQKGFGVGGSVYNSTSSSGTSSSSSSSQTRLTRVNSQRLDTPLVYKRAVIFLRSLYCFVRLLPSFSVYQVTKRSSSSKLLIRSKISVGQATPESEYGPDFLLHEFKQIDTPVGNICAQVSYVSNPVEVLSKEYGNSVMYTSRMAKNQGVPIVKPSKGSEALTNSSQGFAPHSAPQVIRRQSWSFSRNQMQLEAANSRSRFSDVMVIDPVVEGEEKEAKEGRPRENSSPMLIPNAIRKSSTAGAGSSSSINSGSSNLSNQFRVKSSISPGNGSFKALTAPGRSSSLTARVYRTVSASPDECVVGFAMRHDKCSPEVPSHIAKIDLPISALNQRRLESSAAAAGGQSIVKTPASTMAFSVKSGDSSDMSGYRMPLSVSPQLPFAMTPKFSASASSLSYDFQASPMSSGIPSIRIVRRATSPRTSSEMASFNSSSFSPGQDNYLDSGLPYPPLGSYNKARITFPSSNSGTFEEEEQDALPFALETQNSPGETSGVERGESQDAAIGAFVRTLQEAPPLRNFNTPTVTCRTLSSAMLELKQLRETLDTVRLVSN